MTPPIWFPTSWFLAQMTHVLGGMCFVWGGTLLFGWAWWTCVLVSLCWAAPKEFIVDPLVEQSPIWPSGATDFTFYLVGDAVALLALWLARS